MASIIKVDQLSEKTQGSGITLSHSLKLKSSGDSITASDGTTSVLSESAGVVTLNNGTIGSGVTFPAGHVLQVVYQNGTTETSYSSGSSVTLYCGWTASITLSSSSNKIYLSLILPFQVTRSSGQAYLNDVSLYHQKGTLTTSGSGGTLSLSGTSPSNIADLYPYRLGAGGTKDGAITHQRLITTDNVNNHFTFSADISYEMSSVYFNRQYGDGTSYNITLMEVVG
jgi:hypothetical protein